MLVRANMYVSVREYVDMCLAYSHMSRIVACVRMVGLTALIRTVEISANSRQICSTVFTVDMASGTLNAYEFSLRSTKSRGTGIYSG
jgi:hypothetical protein